MDTIKETRSDKLVRNLKQHPLWAILSLIIFVVATFAGFGDSIEKLRKLIAPPAATPNMTTFNVGPDNRVTNIDNRQTTVVHNQFTSSWPQVPETIPSPKTGLTLRLQTHSSTPQAHLKQGADGVASTQTRAVRENGLGQVSTTHKPQIVIDVIAQRPKSWDDLFPFSELGQTALIQDIDTPQSLEGKRKLALVMQALSIGDSAAALRWIEEAIPLFSSRQLELALYSRYIYSAIAGKPAPITIDVDIVAAVYKRGGKTVFSYLNKADGLPVGLSDTFIEGVDVLSVKGIGGAFLFEWRRDQETGCGIVPTLHFGSHWYPHRCPT